MDRIIENKQKYINHIIYSTIVFSLVYLFGLAIRLKLNISLQIISVFVLSTIVSLLLLYPILIYILLGIIFVSTLIISRFFTPYIHMFLERTYILFENIVYHLKGIEGIASENRFIFWGILVIFFSFYTGYIIFKSKRIYLLLPIYSGSFLYYWYHHFDEAYWMMALFLFFYFILMGLDKFSKEKMNIKNRANFSLEELYTPWLKIINRYSFIIVVLALLLPKSSKKIQWSWLQNKVQDTFPVVKELRSTDTTVRAYGKASLFDFSTTGFQEETSRLGGPV